MLHIHNGRVLTDGAEAEADSLTIADGVVAAIGGAAPRGGLTLDARDMLVLPGIVDLHGDAFERQLMPRPGVSIDPTVALLDTDRQLLANGITTAFHAMTWSWEPGLRSREVGKAFVAALTAARADLGCDTRFHLRHETFNFDGEQTVVDWLATRQIDLLAINDHTPGMAAKIDRGRSLASTAERAGLSLDAFADLLSHVVARAPEVEASVGRICGVARAQGVPMASHDDESAATRDAYAALGCAICEFPQNIETARHARATGASVVMGAPNVLRGGSHIGLVGAADLILRGLCDILCSDYFYPALLGAPFRQSRRRGRPSRSRGAPPGRASRHRARRRHHRRRAARGGDLRRRRARLLRRRLRPVERRAYGGAAHATGCRGGLTGGGAKRGKQRDCWNHLLDM
jgi:alpha-D-ribose 1-methylphosphonate 5-triphosphate diphosphatase